MKLAASLALGLSLSLTCLVGCGKPGLEEDCEIVNGEDECAEGLVCGESAEAKPHCQKLCNTSADCAASQDCVASTSTETSTTATLACRTR